VNVSGATQLAAVIGWPVEHSRSPAIHNAAARAAGVDLVYTAMAVRPGEAAEAAASMRTLGIRGLSVTMPHKVDVIDALDELTPVAQKLGAVNHITNTDGYLVGNNTDGEGFVLGLCHDAGIDDLTGKRVVVFGAGGAARAIVHACGDAGAEVVVLARDHKRGETAAQMGSPNARTGSADDLKAADIIVNATPVGMAGGELADATPFDVAALRDDAVVVDIVYDPLETPLLAQARAREMVVVDGLSMLVGQAAAQFEAWTGVSPSLEVMRQAVRL